MAHEEESNLPNNACEYCGKEGARRWEDGCYEHLCDACRGLSFCLDCGQEVDPGRSQCFECFCDDAPE